MPLVYLSSAGWGRVKYVGRDEMRLLCGHKGSKEREKAGLKRNKRYKKREQVRKKKRERGPPYSAGAVCQGRSQARGECVFCVCVYMCDVGEIVATRQIQ